MKSRCWQGRLYEWIFLSLRTSLTDSDEKHWDSDLPTPVERSSKLADPNSQPLLLLQRFLINPRAWPRKMSCFSPHREKPIINDPGLQRDAQLELLEILSMAKSNSILQFKVPFAFRIGEPQDDEVMLQLGKGYWYLQTSYISCLKNIKEINHIGRGKNGN